MVSSGRSSIAASGRRRSEPQPHEATRPEDEQRLRSGLGSLGIDSVTEDLVLEAVRDARSRMLTVVTRGLVPDENRDRLFEAVGHVASTADYNEAVVWLNQQAAVSAAYRVASEHDVEGAAGHLGVSGARIRQRLADASLFGHKRRGAWRLPSWQFTLDGTLPNVEDAAAAVSELDVDWETFDRFMTTATDDLPGPEGALAPAEFIASGGSWTAVLDRLKHRLDI